MSEDDVFGYQRAVCSNPEVVGYDELLNLSGIEDVIAPNPSGPILRQLAMESVAADDPLKPARLAIVTPNEGIYAFGRMYAAYRELQHGSNRTVQVFMLQSEALAWLGIEASDVTDAWIPEAPPDDT